ncbi:hypothetical protein G6F22_017655 [Rhizopus arrhizus]|nr:hypothetical protein G6F22_017655 [Rhizopus arrhizus]
MAADLVAQIEGFAAGVGDAVVVPGRQAELMGVARPAIGLPAFRDHGADRGIGNDVDPGRRRALVACGGDDVFLAVGREAAQAVGVQQPPGG